MYTKKSIIFSVLISSYFCDLYGYSNNKTIIIIIYKTVNLGDTLINVC